MHGTGSDEGLRRAPRLWTAAGSASRVSSNSDTRLAGRRDGHDLAFALRQLAPPGPIQPQVPVAVELVEDAEGRDDAVSGLVVR